jgi:hypothetical protein
MKKIFQVLLASGLVLGMSAIAKAQPPEQKPIEYPSQMNMDSVITDFYRTFDSQRFGYEGELADWQKPDNKALDEMHRIIANRLGNYSVEPTDAIYTVNPHDPSLITVHFTLKLDDYGLNFHIAQADSIQLKRHADNNGVQWLIVPGDPQKYFDAPLVDLQPKASQPISGITENIATLVAFPEKMLPVVQLHQSMTQLKAIVLGMFYFMQDYDEHLAFTPQNFREKLKMYTRNESFFTAPGDAAGVTSYSLNPSILGEPDIESYDNRNVVAFYLGHDQNLDFRYDGLSPVCFMDGHVKAVTPEEAKNLRWKP